PGTMLRRLDATTPQADLRARNAPKAEYSAASLPIPRRRRGVQAANLGAMDTTQRESSRTEMAVCRRVRAQVASAREGAPDGRHRGIFSRKDTKMEPVFNPMLFDDAAGSSAERTEPRKTRAGGKSRAAEYIAALYIALLVCAPWL